MYQLNRVHRVIWDRSEQVRLYDTHLLSATDGPSVLETVGIYSYAFALGRILVLFSD